MLFIYLSLVILPGKTIYDCESKVVTPSNVVPELVPWSTYWEKVEGECGVNFVAKGSWWLIVFRYREIVFPVSSFKTSLCDWLHKVIVLESFCNSPTGGVKAAVYNASLLTRTLLTYPVIPLDPKLPVEVAFPWAPMYSDLETVVSKSEDDYPDASSTPFT